MYLSAFVLNRRIAEAVTDPKSWKVVSQDRQYIVIKHKRTRRVISIPITSEGLPRGEKKRERDRGFTGPSFRGMIAEAYDGMKNRLRRKKR